MIRRMDWIAAAIAGVAGWSLCGIILSLALGSLDSAWDFACSLGGCGVTLVLVALYQARCHG